MLRFTPVTSLLRLPTLGYTFVSPFRSVRFRAGVLRFAPVASFAPAHVALRAAFGRLPSQRPLACVRCATVASVLRCAPVAHPGLHICLSLWTCAIARVFSAALRLPPSLPLMSPYGLPAAGYPASARWHVFVPELAILPPRSPRLRVRPSAFTLHGGIRRPAARTPYQDSRCPCIYFGQTLISCFPGFRPPKGPAPGFAGSRGLPK